MQLILFCCCLCHSVALEISEFPFRAQNSVCGGYCVIEKHFKRFLILEGAMVDYHLYFSNNMLNIFLQVLL